MEIALLEAKNSNKEVPVGCVIVKNGEILAKAHNLKEKMKDITAHAEIIAIKEAEKKLGSWRLLGCDLYVTLEPCPMCAWAILTCGIQNIYFSAYDLNYGAFGSKMNLLKEFNFKGVKVFGGIMEDEAKFILNSYFSNLRKN